MFSTLTPTLTLLAAAATCVHAEPNPSGPGPNDVFIQGRPCTISWDADLTGVWKDMDVELMTGNNFEMSSLTAVAKAIDGTNPKKNTYSYTCPQVSPHSAIYFYQFTSPSTANKTWTSRFTITDSAKNIVPPSESTQPDGQKIPWGTGSLVKESSVTASGLESRTGTSTTGGNTTSSAPSTTTSSQSSVINTSTTSVEHLSSDASPTSTDGYTIGVNSAAGMVAASNIFLQTTVALALAAFGFTLMS